MRRIKRRDEGDYIERLQISRLFRAVSSQPADDKGSASSAETFYQNEQISESSDTERPNAYQNTVSIPAADVFVSRDNTTDVKNDFTEREDRTAGAIFFRRLTRRKAQSVARSEAYNFLPRVPGAGRRRIEILTQPARIRVLAVFVGTALIVASFFPIVRIIENQRQAAHAVLGASTSAYQSFSAGTSALLASDPEAAQTDLAQAYAGFSEARADLEEVSGIIRLLPYAAEAEKLLSIAQDASLGMQYASIATQNLLNLRFGENGLISVSGSSAADELSSGIRNLSAAIRYLEASGSALAETDFSFLPSQYGKKLSEVENVLHRLLPGLRRLVQLERVMLGLANAENRTYLLLFQNYRELRATGGFIGTYGVFDLDRGSIKDLKIETVYNPDGQLREQIAAPGPLQRTLTQRWAMRDSNWFFDFPTSARKAIDFFQMSSGRQVDAAVAFTPEVFVRLLAITGPVEMPEYGETLTAENFTKVVQYQTSEAYDRVLNQPKKFLADFAPRLLEKVSRLEADGWLDVVDALIRSLGGKDILLYSNDRQEQSLFESLNWAGRVRQEAGDYLAVVHSNVGGGKTDQNIQQKISVEVDQLPNGNFRHRLEIEATHNPGDEKEFPVNVDFMRVYVPAGSELISAEGFDQEVYRPSRADGAETDSDLALIDSTTMTHAGSGTLVYSESGRTVFANWLQLVPGASRKVTIEYQTPQSIVRGLNDESLYSLVLQKQPGSRPTILDVRVNFHKPADILWKYPVDVQSISDTSLSWQTDFLTDRVMGLITKPKP